MPSAPWQLAQLSAVALPAATSAADTACTSRRNASTQMLNATPVAFIENTSRSRLGAFQREKVQAGCPTWTQIRIKQGSLAVADPVNGAVEVVSDEQRAIRGDEHVVRPPQIFAVGVDPARGKLDLFAVLAVRISGYAH